MTDDSIFQLNISGPEGFRAQFQIPVGITTIGRQSDNTLRLNHSRVSRKHASLTCTPDGCRLADLGSSNGTYVDGEKLVPEVTVQLSSGATIKIGPFVLTFDQIPVAPRQEEAKPPAKRTSEEPTRKIPSEKALPAQEPERELKAERAGKKPHPESVVFPPPNFPSKGSVPLRDSPFPTDLSAHGQRLLRYLPGIYQTDFMKRFLAIFESILTPIEWNVDNFDIFLDSATAPPEFLPWLANWFEITFDATWSEEQRRTLLKEAHKIYARRGTKWALSRVLEIYIGQEAEIDDTDDELEAFTFTVTLPVRQKDVNKELIEAIIDTNKPAHTIYTLKFER